MLLIKLLTPTELLTGCCDLSLINFLERDKKRVEKAKTIRRRPPPRRSNVSS